MPAATAFGSTRSIHLPRRCTGSIPDSWRTHGVGVWTIWAKPQWFTLHNCEPWQRPCRMLGRPQGDHRMNRIRTKWRGCRASVAMFCLGIAVMIAPGRGEETYPRANAVATMQALAGELDRAYAQLFPALNAVVPASVRFKLERNLADI